MAFQPRMNEATGKACCMETLADGRRKLPSYPCDKCAAHFGRAASLRTAAPNPYAPPDPYKAGIDAQRASDAKDAAARTYQPAALRPTEFPAGYTPPDPYKAQLERLREENNR